MANLLLYIAVILTTGCPSPDLGEAPFLCHVGEPACPDGYVCIPQSDGKKVCVKKSKAPDSSLTDASSSDMTKNADQASGGLDMESDQATSQTLRVSFSEFMAYPIASLETYGEWIELHNLGQQSVDINGWTLKSAPAETHIINFGGPLIIPADGYIILGKNTDKSSNGGVDVAYAYSTISLENDKDDLFLIDSNGKTVDSFGYSTTLGFTIPSGASLSVKDPIGNKSNGLNWCTETSLWTGSKGDKGTPGAPAKCK